MDNKEYQNGLLGLLNSEKFWAVMTEEVSAEALRVFSVEKGLKGGRCLGARLYYSLLGATESERLTNAHILDFYYRVDHCRNMCGNVDFSGIEGYGKTQHELLGCYVKKRIFIGSRYVV